MELIDKHFVALPTRKKVFLGILTLAYLLIAIIGFKTGLFGLVESFLILVVGILYTELIKLQYRVQDLEK